MNPPFDTIIVNLHRAVLSIVWALISHEDAEKSTEFSEKSVIDPNWPDPDALYIDLEEFLRKENYGTFIDDVEDQMYQAIEHHVLMMKRKKGKKQQEAAVIE